MTIYLHKYMFSNAVPMHVEIKYIGHVTIIPEHEKNLWNCHSVNAEAVTGTGQNL